MKPKSFLMSMALVMLCSGTIIGQNQSASLYQTPPKAIADIVNAPGMPSISFSPKYDRYIIAQTSGLPTIHDMAQEEIALAGIRFLPATNAPRFNTKILSLAVYATDASAAALSKSKIVQGLIKGLPKDPIVAYYSDPTGSRVAILIETDNGIECWVAELTTLEARKISDKFLNGLFLSGIDWTPDGQAIILGVIPQRQVVPAPDKTPKGPVVQVSEGKAAPVRTYQDMLKDKYSEDLFDYYAQTEIIKIDLQTGKEQIIAPKAIYSNFSLSPDGNYFLTTTIHKPYSYTVPAYFFPSTTEVWSLDGKKITKIDESPLVESMPLSRGSTRAGKRGFSWRTDQPATLYWIAALDGGDAKVQAEKRDEVWILDAPFTGAPRSFMRTDLRFSGISWGDAHHAFVYTSNAEKRMRYTYMFDPEKPAELKQVFALFTEDRYADPGNISMERGPYGRSIVRSLDQYKTIYLMGNGAGPEGARPFIDQYTIATAKTKRVWQCNTTHYESPVALVNLKDGNIIIRRESPTEWPNYYAVNIKSKKMSPITQFPDPSASLKGVSKEVVEYTRKDGIKLSGTLYLPAGYKKSDGPLPVFMWAYPAEFQSAAGAGQRTDSPNTYIRASRSGIVPFVTQGYAIFDNVSFPIVGPDGKEPNDTFVEQLVMNAEAAINVLAKMGVGDPKRVAVGGHSYGAFMTANLLAHSNLFAAGIARSGAYNRTLTPFGFQNETRTFWEAPDLYMNMSPFRFANQITTPLLMIHGLADNNPGTFTLQSERLFAAVKGAGGIAKLVLLPCESHGYAAQESLLQTAWETYMWLEKYVKNKK